ncbi:MAG: ABC transporter permease [Arachnia sp.]
MTLATLLRRQLQARPWPTLLLALTLLVAAALAAAVPRLSADLDDRQLAQRLASLSAIRGDVTGTWGPQMMYGPWDVAGDPWPEYTAKMESIRESQPEPLRSLLEPAQFVARYATASSFTPPVETGYFRVSFDILADPGLATQAELVDGAWPRVGGPEDIVEVAVPEVSATRMGWHVGDQLGQAFRLVGTFRPLDPDDVRWEHVELGRRYHELSDPNNGLELHTAFFVDPAMLGSWSDLMSATFGITGWFRLDPTRVAGVDVDTLSAQLTSLLSHPWVVRDATDDRSAEDTRLSSELGGTLASVAAQQRGMRALIAVSAAGPLGVAAALVVLAARLVADRRRTTLTLTSARGMSPRQQRRLAAAEGLLVGLPAAILGTLLAWALTPGGVPGPVTWLIAVALAAAPAAALAWQTAPTSGRHDLSSRGGKARLVAEALVLLAGIAAVWRLLAGPSAADGLDVLGAAAPLLVALAGCLAVLRAYPFPLRWLHRLLRPQPGLTGFLGSARALREPGGGPIPVIAVALGSALALSGSILLGTLSQGTERAVWEHTGSSLQVGGPRLTAEMADAIRALDGVTAVTRLREGGTNVRLTVGGADARVRVWLADRELLEAYAVGFERPPVPASLFDGGDPVPAVFGGEVPDGATGQLDQFGPVRRVAHLDLLPGVLPGLGWVVIDADRWPGGDTAKSTLALVALSPDADAAAVAATVESMVPNAKVTSAASSLAELRASPTVSGLTAIFALLAGTTALLLVLAISAAQLLGAESRRALAAVLSTLGMPRRRLRSLAAWELGPVVAVALLFGLALGVGVAALLVRAVDFAALTGGATTPALALDPLAVGGVVGGLLAAAVVSIVVSAALAGRADVAQQLRIGEDR